MAAETKCPCGSDSAFADCCEAVLVDATKAETAEQLLRARYTAFTKKNVDFILDTHHARTRDEVTRESIQEWADHSDWLGLEIHDQEGGGKDDTEGRLNFTARYKQAEHEIDHTEQAVFERDGDRWYFVTGRQPPARRAAPKIGRNEPCPCGSGKKYKRCCLNAKAG